MSTSALHRLASVVLLGALLLGACSRRIESGSPRLPQHWLAERLELSPDDIRIVLADEREWSDSCLGVGGPAESCLAVATPGWQFILEARGELFEVRADRLGTELRSPQLASGTPGRPGEPAGAS